MRVNAALCERHWRVCPASAQLQRECAQVVPARLPLSWSEYAQCCNNIPLGCYWLHWARLMPGRCEGSSWRAESR